ncbi:MAG: hypothetical protein H7Y19_12630 [Luteimonas sp.]|nr:hypothetical protein [Luteimonas sp.]
MFPTGRPGVALLLVRIALGLMLMDGVSVRLLQLGSIWFLAAPALVALSLGVGFLTPVAAGLCILLELTTLVTAGGPIEAVHVCALLDAVAIGLLGPGAYSVDVRLFGRRLVVLPSRRDPYDR